MTEPIRILVAEDHLVARVGVSAIVNMQPDMTVVAEASNGSQAVEQFRQHRPDIALLDLRMPVMSGTEAAAAIRKEFPDARMIALTTYGMPLVVEIGIFFDVVIAVMVLGILVCRIRESFASMDVSKLNELKW